PPNFTWLVMSTTKGTNPTTCVAWASAATALLPGRKVPLMYTCAARCAPSNSTRIFRSEYCASSAKCLRYQLLPPTIDPSPPPLSWLRNVSTSFHVCGTPTSAQLESSNAGSCAPLGSMFLRNFHGVCPRLIVTRWDAGSDPASNGAGAESGP